VRISQIFSHHDGEKILKSNFIIWEDLQKVFTNPGLQLKKGYAHTIKVKVSDSLNSLGWADRVTIEPTRLTINFIKQKVGICIQLGNVARTYADLLKTQVLFDRKLIKVGVIAVPMRTYSKRIGSNIAQYERLVEEVKLFENIITVPLLIIGIST
jgi:hypothetical protein